MLRRLREWHQYISQKIREKDTNPHNSSQTTPTPTHQSQSIGQSRGLCNSLHSHDSASEWYIVGNILELFSLFRILACIIRFGLNNQNIEKSGSMVNDTVSTETMPTNNKWSKNSSLGRFKFLVATFCTYLGTITLYSIVLFCRG